MIVLLIIFIYIIQVWIMSLIHIVNESRSPKSIVDFLTMTIMPITVFRLKRYKK